MQSTSKKKSSTVGKGKGKGSKEPEAHKNAMEKSKAKKSKQKKKKEKKKDKVQKNKALDKRDFNILGQLFQLNKSVAVIDQQGREVEEKEKELERTKKELQPRERGLDRKEGKRNKENSNEVIFRNLERTVTGPSHRYESDVEDDENKTEDFSKYKLSASASRSLAHTKGRRLGINFDL